jgi:glucose/arabinose dehydrogenase
MHRHLLTLFAILVAGCANADAQRPFTVEAIAEFDEPWAMAFLPDGRLLVTEKATEAREVSVTSPCIPASTKTGSCT